MRFVGKEVLVLSGLSDKAIEEKAFFCKEGAPNKIVPSLPPHPQNLKPPPSIPVSCLLSASAFISSHRSCVLPCLFLTYLNSVISTRQKLQKIPPPSHLCPLVEGEMGKVNFLFWFLSSLLECILCHTDSEDQPFSSGAQPKARELTAALKKY